MMQLLIIDDHEVIRRGLIATLTYETYFDRIGEASNVEEGIKQLRIMLPEVTVVDLKLGNNESGFEVIRRAQREQIVTKFIILASHARKADFIEGERLGVQGYISKAAELEDIIYAIRTVAKGKIFYSSEFKERHTKTKQEEIKESLTGREYEVLCALGKGLTNAQIAEVLFITENTVKKHISSILGKLDLSHRTEGAILSANLWRRKEDS